MNQKLTNEHYQLLMSIKGGADVFGYADAKLCREIERIEPSYIEITKAMGEYSPIGRLPYFGAIATEKGVAVARGVLSTDKKVGYL